jgi:putative DNA primase/helicase
VAAIPADQVGPLKNEGGSVIQAAEIHARIGSAWPQILAQLGVPESALRNRHGPCPACGGKDRFRFDNKRGRGDYICGQCGAGDGFTLLERVFGWRFTEARKRVIEVAGLGSDEPRVRAGRASTAAPTPDETPQAKPSERVLRLRRDRCAVANCADAVTYLSARGLWPLPEGCAVHAHATVEYFDAGHRLGRFPALLADISDITGALISVHVTYLQGGKKLASHEPRKIFSPLTGRSGCAVRLMPATDVLGIAEGIETALSAAAIDGIAVWAALNTSLLSRFEPPPGITRLRIYADRDEAGLAAACRLMERLQGRMRLEVRIPTAPAKDFNDVLISRGSHHE